MPTSSARYSATIHPDARLRALVTVSGVALSLSGLVAVANLPLEPLLRLALGAAWTGLALSELVRQWRRTSRVAAYRLHADGSLDLLITGGGARPARLMTGSVVSEEIGWLRVAAPGIGTWGELVAGNCRKNKEWRRLRVIFRHRSA